MKKLTICAETLMLIFVLFLTACGGGSGGAANNAPVAFDADISLLPGNSISGTLVVSNTAGGNLSISIVTEPSNGSVSIDDTTTGAYTYMLDDSASGDSFTFWANDGLLDSNIATVTVTGTIPTIPGSGLQATPDDQRIMLNWDAAPGAESYNVYWSDTPGSGTGGTQIPNVTPPFYHNNLGNGLNYYYIVTSVNAVGESGASIELAATPVDILLSSLSFTDTNLDACVTDAIAAADPDLLFVHELTLLECTNRNIANLDGIEALTGIYILFLGNNSITDVSPLTGLTGLSRLDLYDNSITDVSTLSGLTSLRQLHIYNNNIMDVNALSDMTDLTFLSLYSNSIIDVSPLSGLTSLTTLFLYNNSIGGQGIGNVDDLINLTSANIWLTGNTGMSCSELATLIIALNSPPVDTDGDLGTTDVPTDGVNCTSP